MHWPRASIGEPNVAGKWRLPSGCDGLEQGHVRWDEALAATKLIVTDEESARHQIEDMQDRPAKYPFDRPPGSFWRSLWRILQACERDAPAEDAAAAAMNNLQQLPGMATLEDTREILDRQAAEEWAARRAKPVKNEP